MDEIVLNERYGCMEVIDLGEEYDEKHPDEEIHYKCQCRCGRISYFNKKTLEHKPRYCYYPVMITENHYYCAKIREATERKRQKYAGLENVVLKGRSECGPSKDYCYRYNAYWRSQQKRKEKMSAGA